MADETGTREPMADTRLDEIGAAVAIVKGPTIAHELYAEAVRARQAETTLRETIADGEAPGPYEYGRVSVDAFARKVAEKIQAEGRLREACREVDRLRAQKAQERSAIEAEVEAEVRQRIAAELDKQGNWAADRDVNGPDCVEAVTWRRAAQIVRGGDGG
jgi:hypothetical protein